jgi:hypothetical protein
MTPDELYQKYEKAPKDGGHGFHTWQKEIFDRVREAVKNDEEAICLLNYTLEFAEMKARCAG